MSVRVWEGTVCRRCVCLCVCTLLVVVEVREGRAWLRLLQGERGMRECACVRGVCACVELSSCVGGACV